MTDRANKDRFWVMRGQSPDGPFDVEQIHWFLANGTIGWQTLACQVGFSDWLPLISMPGIGPGASTPSSPPPTTSITNFPRTGASPQHGPAPIANITRPWNPRLIAILSLLFTPMWGSVMAAINGPRLGSRTSPWIPIFIGGGYLAVEIAWSIYFPHFDSTLLSWVIYLMAAALLWGAVLQRQAALFDSTPGRPSGTWVWPSVTGAPLAALFLLAFVVSPFLPLDPYIVCERFTQSHSANQKMEFASQNLRHSMNEISSNLSAVTHWELLGEEPAPVEVGGYLVGFRTMTASRVRTEGIFHLMPVNGVWKIEEIYITRRRNDDFVPWGKLSEAPFLIDDRQKLPMKSHDGSQEPAAQKAPQQFGGPDNKAVTNAAARSLTAFLSSGAAKAVGLGLLAALAAIAKFGRQIWQTICSSSPGTQ